MLSIPFFILSGISATSRWKSIPFWPTLLIAALCVMTAQAIQPEVITKINYGAAFLPVGKIQATANVWTHTFQLQLPRINHTWSSVKCRNNSCNHYESIWKEMVSLQQESYHHMNETISIIEDLVPEHRLSDIPKGQSHSKRAIFGFVGSLSSKLFGTATKKDIAIITAHVKQMQNKTESLSSAFQHQQSQLSSFMTNTGHRFRNMLRGVESNHEDIQTIMGSLSSVQEAIVQVAKITKLLNQQTYASIKIQQQMDVLLQGIYELIEGKLAPTLIPPSSIMTAITHIKKIKNIILGFKSYMIIPPIIISPRIS